MKTTLTILLICCISVLKAQQLPWDSANAWYIFQVPHHEVLTIKADSLDLHKRMKVDLKKTNMYVKNAKKISSVYPPVWMGGSVAAYCLPDSTIHKVLVSDYGGILFDATTRSYYEIPESITAKWMDFVIEQRKRLKYYIENN